MIHIHTLLTISSSCVICLFRLVQNVIFKFIYTTNIWKPGVIIWKIVNSLNMLKYVHGCKCIFPHITNSVNILFFLTLINTQSFHSQHFKNCTLKEKWSWWHTTIYHTTSKFKETKRKQKQMIVYIQSINISLKLKTANIYLLRICLLWFYNNTMCEKHSPILFIYWIWTNMNATCVQQFV